MTELTREQKLDILQKEFSRKDLDMGCIIKDEDGIMATYIRKRTDLTHTLLLNGKLITYDEDIIPFGHPVILSDILLWLTKQEIIYEINNHTEEDKKLSKLISIFSINYYLMYEFYRDLSLPYLSEQDDYFINGLYEVVLLSKVDTDGDRR